MFRNLGVCRQITALMLMSVAAIVIGAILYHTTLTRVTRQADAALTTALETASTSADLNRRFASRAGIVQSLLREKDPDRMEVLIGQLEKSRIDLTQHFPADRPESKPVLAAATAWDKTTTAIVEKILIGNNADAYTSFINEATPQYGTLLKSIDDLNTQSRQELVAGAEASHRAVTRLCTILLISAGVGAGGLGLIGIFMPRRIGRSLRRAIDELRSAATQVNEAASQVSAAAQQSAQNTVAQTSNIEQTVQAIADIATMTTSNAQASQQADELAANAQNDATRGNDTMTQLTAAIRSINDSSSEMSKIIKVIEEIAFQTNLLALNAAVEAARAGEHGKGFAVVAEEVRNLAMRSAEAARSTNKLITESVQRAKDSDTVCHGVGGDLSQIGQRVNGVAALLQQINQASEQQSHGVQQLRDSIGSIEKVTSQNAAVAEEAASAAEELTSMATMLKDRVVSEMSMIVLGARQAA